MPKCASSTEAKHSCYLARIFKNILLRPLKVSMQSKVFLSCRRQRKHNNNLGGAHTYIERQKAGLICHGFPLCLYRVTGMELLHQPV